MSQKIRYLLSLYVADGRKVIRWWTHPNIRDFDFGAASALYDGTPELVISQKIETRRPSSVWHKLLTVPKGIEILDPDGWDRKHFTYSWEKECITEREYEKRLSVSTLRWYQNRRP